MLARIPRDRTIAMTPEITSALLETIDAVRSPMEALETTGQESSADRTSLLSRRAKLQSSGGSESEFELRAIDQMPIPVAPNIAKEQIPTVCVTD